MNKCKLYNDNFQNYKRYDIKKAQLVIADIPYNVGNFAYGSNPSWYVDGDNKNGESKNANASFLERTVILKFLNICIFVRNY